MKTPTKTNEGRGENPPVQQRRIVRLSEDLGSDSPVGYLVYFDRKKTEAGYYSCSKDAVTLAERIAEVHKEEYWPIYEMWAADFKSNTPAQSD